MTQLTRQDFVSGQDPRWCPGCGDYAILAAVQNTMTKIGKKKEDIVFISGIGCSSRFPYYMNTYGMHTIHGRGLAIASGLKIHNPSLSVWAVTGDGDSLSIGGNHFIHVLRRNIDINILLFNNEIYGLTKGQYSPTTKQGKITKSSPFGSLDRSFNPSSLALGAGATFFARSMDTDVLHMQEMMLRASEHKGTSLVELYQNCLIFNNKAHDLVTNRLTTSEYAIRLVHGQKMIFGKNKNKGLILEGSELKVIEFSPENPPAEILTHDENHFSRAFLLGQMKGPDFPVAIGVLYNDKKQIYEEDFYAQMESVKEKNGTTSVFDLLHTKDCWEVK